MYVGALTGSHADVGQLIALCDTNPVRMDYHRSQAGLPDLPGYGREDFVKMLEEQQPDCVIVTSPDHSHDEYICAALDRGIDVITEKPMTIDADKLAAIVKSLDASSASLTVTFNYRYSPRNSVVKELISSGAIGKVTSVHFEWLLDTSHGADYFRRWHRNKINSGGLLVHKSTHHFDLVNWWLADIPASVYAQGGLKFYGDSNAAERGLGERAELSRDNDPTVDRFRLDMSADPKLKALYLDAESADGYHRDQDVFAPGIDIEDSLNLIVGYGRGATMSYSLNAFAPWEGYRVGFNGTEGRIELDVVERSWVRSADDQQRRGKGVVVDPSAVADDSTGETLRPEGERVLLQRHWEAATEVEIPTGTGGHGGGDNMLLDDLFRGTSEDPLGRAAGYVDGMRSVVVGIAGNRSLAEERKIDTAELGIDLDPTQDGDGGQ